MGRSLCSGLAPLRSGLLPAPGLATRPHGYMTSSIPARRPPPAALRGASPHHGQQGKGSWPPDFSPALSSSSSCAQEPHFCFAKLTPSGEGGREGGGGGERERERSVPTSKRLPKGNAAAVPGTSAGSAGSIGGLRGRLSVFLPSAAARSGLRAPRCDPGVPGWGGTSAVHRPHDCD